MIVRAHRLSPAKGALIGLGFPIALLAAIGVTWIEMDRLVSWSGLNDLPPIPAKSLP